MKWHYLFVGSILFWLGSIEFHASAAQPNQRPLLKTKWASEVSSTHAHLGYPRPTMTRSNWLNLNGLWDFAISQRGQTNAISFNQQILVPFPVESQLSGIHRLITELQCMMYRHSFEIPKQWDGQRILLHFEAVDWEAEVWINGVKVGTHQGGYDRFSLDITDALKREGNQILEVSVYDPTDSGFQPRGKQMLHPRPPFLSASSGIWQTVWVEPVPIVSIASLKLIPDVDAGVLKITVQGNGTANSLTVEAVASEGMQKVGQANGELGTEFKLAIPHAKLWSPTTPFLYDLKITLLQDGKKVDSVSSYFGLRKISLANDQNGNPRLMLNNQPLFQLGPLDQGYWPDGTYTAPTDDALRYDIEVMKQLGFNMCRKHVKVEPELWYYWCDKVGLLVWQDMPNGDRPATLLDKEIQRKPKSAREFEQDLKQMIVGRGNHPCIVMWIPFNQGWGQYDTSRITGMVKELDPSRLVADASGWNDMGCGDVRSLHKYPGPATPEHDGQRACVIGECGGLGIAISEHMWGGITPWNTVYFQTPEKLANAYGDLITNLIAMKDRNGLAGAVITQLTDVEKELNGFMTYDRAIIKMPVDTVRTLNEKLLKPQDTAPIANQKQSH